MKIKTPLDYAKAACETIMEKYDAPLLPPYASDRTPPHSWFAYHQGVFLSGMMRVYDQCGEDKYFDYIHRYINANINDDGTLIHDKTGWMSLESLDSRQPGILLFGAYEKVHDERYIKVLEYLVESLKDYPTNPYGGFWHMTYQKQQMWLDGLYMAGPLCVMYAAMTGKTEFFDIAAKQVIVMWENMRDEKTGLLLHAWDCSKEAEWANPKTGLSPEVWGRAAGWFVTAIADILDYLPKEHKDRERIIEIERQALCAIVKYQDASGRWWQVLDKVGCEGNWQENSCSCLYTYALAKSVRMGYIDESFKEYVKKGYEGVINSLGYGENGELLVRDVCIGTCIGDYEFYCNRESCVNDLHGSGAFVLMCSEVQKLKDIYE